MQRAGIYTRLSRDRDGNQTATRRQREDAESLCKAKAWPVVRVYEDVDLSAYKDIKRPAYEEMLRDIADGVIDGVVVWKLDRLMRSPAEFERFWAVCDKHNASLAAVNDPVDTSSEVGLVVVRMLVSMARLETANMSTRLRRQARESAERGRRSGGGTRPFGLTADWSRVIPEEAKLIQQAAERILAGETAGSVIREWARSGVVGPSGKPITRPVLRGILTSARTAGCRELDGKFYGGGNIPAILDEPTVRALRDIYKQPSRRKSPGSARKHLLSGFAYCGRCGTRLIARPRGDGKLRYVCPNDPSRPGCNGLACLAEPVDQLVRDSIMAVLETSTLAEILREADGSTLPVVDELAAAESALAQLAVDHYAEQRITREEFHAAREILTTKIETARAQLGRDSRRAVLVDAATGGVAQAWDERGLGWRRALVNALIARIVINPQDPKGSRRFHPERVVIEWRA